MSSLFHMQDQGIFVNNLLSEPPKVSCSYEAPDQCTGFEPQPCCERVAVDGAPPVMTSSLILVASSLLSVVLASYVYLAF